MNNDNRPSLRGTRLSAQGIRRVVSLSLIAVLSLGFALVIGLLSILERAQSQLEETAAESVQLFDDFIGDIKQDLTITSSILPTSRDINKPLRLILNRQPAIFETLLVDKQGQVMIQRRRVGEGPQVLEEQPWLETTQDGEIYLGPVDYEAFGVPFVDLAVPVFDEDDQFWVTLVARVDLTSLWDTIISLRIGETGYAYLVDDDGTLLSYQDLQLVRNDVTLGEVAGFSLGEITQPGFKTYLGLDGERVISSSSSLENMPWYVIVEQPIQEALLPFAQLALGALFLLLAVGVLIYSTVKFAQRRIVNPLSELRQGVENIQMGNLKHRIALSDQNRDELWELGDTLNTMTAQIEELIGNLEKNVAERTADLARRARQMEAAADVARDAVSIRDVDQLLDETVDLISKQFGFYHAGIFLIDDAEKYAILAAASSPGGKQMLERGHRLKVGEVGIVGYVTGSGEPRIALDVGEDAVYFDNPDLPQTRSEMAVPLMVRNEIIGALDVQSTKAEAFDEDDISILRTMADQIAVALDNARLLSRSQQVVAELQATQQEQVLSAWQFRQQIPAFEYDRINVTETEPADEQAGSSIQDDLLIVAEQEDERSVLSAPLRLRDQTIGGLSLEQIGAARSWTEDEIELVEEVSEQIALALENARLFEEAQERAIRERTMSEVTNKMRETLNVDSVIRTAVEEIYAMLDLEHVTIRLTEQAAHPADSEEEGTT